MFKVTWRGVRQHPVRFALSVLAVVLGISFVTGTFALRSLMASTFHEIVDTSMSADLYVRGTPLAGASNVQAGNPTQSGPARHQVNADLATTIEGIPGVNRAFADVQGTAILVGGDGTAVQTSGAPTLVFPFYRNDSTVSLASGKYPSGEHEIALDTDGLKRAELKIGDKTQWIVNGDIADVTITGSLTFRAGTSGAVLVAMDPSAAMTLFAPEGKVGTVSVYLDEGVAAAPVKAAVATAVAGDSAEVVTGAVMREEAKSSIDTMLGFVSTFLLIFAAIALFVGGFIIANTFTMSVRQRLREIAVLRAIGATPGQVFASVVGQAAIVGAVGAALGVLAGSGLVVLIREVFAQMGMEMAAEIPFETSTVIIGMVIGIGVSVCAAAIPARHAARVAPVDAMNESVRTNQRSLRTRGIIGGSLVLLGVAGVLLAINDDAHSGSWLGMGASLTLIGALVWSPAIAPAVMRVLAWPIVKFGRPLGSLALGNVVRNPRRTASTAGALMIGMALVGGASVLAASTQASMRAIVDDNVKSAYVMRGAQGFIPEAATAAVAKVPGVGHIDELWVGPLQIDGAETYVVAGSPGLFERSMTIGTVSGSLAALDDNKVLVQKPVAKEKGWAVGDTLQLGSKQGERTETVVIGGVVESAGIGVGVIVPQPVFDRVTNTNDRMLEMLFVNAPSETNLETLRTDLTTAVKPFLIVSVMDADEFSSELAKQVQQVLTILYALLGLSIVIAVLGIVNTLALSIMERTREIGLMRAVGLGRLQLSGVVIIESVLIAVFGAAAGLAVGVGVAAAVPSVFRDSGLTELVIPWGSLGAMVLLAGGVGVFAALWPAVRAARLPVLESVTYD